MRTYKYLYILIIILFGQTFYSQNISWEKTKGPYGGFITVLYQSNNGKIFAGGRGKLYTKENNEQMWHLTLRTYTDSYATTIVENSQGEIFASFGIGTFRSNDNGTTWEIMNSGINGLTINKLNIDDQDNLYTAGVVSNYARIFKSTNNGMSWFVVYSYQFSYDFRFVHSGENGLVFASHFYTHFIRSTDYGQNWETISLPNLEPIRVVHITQEGIIYAAETPIDTEIWKSTNNGEDWYAVSIAPPYGTITSMESDSDQNLYLGLTDGIFRSTDGGVSWNNITYDLRNKWVWSIELINDSSIQIGSHGRGVIGFSDMDTAWVENNVGLNDVIIESIIVDENNNVWVGSLKNGIFYTSNAGNSWIEQSNGIRINAHCELVVSRDNDIFAVGDYSVQKYNRINHIWEVKLGYGNLYLGIKEQDTIFAGSGTMGIAVSYDNGETWNWSPPYYSFISSIKVLNDRSTLAGGANKIYHSTNHGISWETFFEYNNYGLTDIEQMDTGYLLAAYHLYDNNPPSFDGKLLLSTDNGQGWTSIADSINPYIYCIVPYTNNRIFIGTKNGVYLSTDHGNEWQQLNDGLDDLYIHSLAIDDFGYIYAGTEEGLYKSNSNIITNLRDQEIPQSFYLSQNYPNPFNPTTTIKYKIPGLSFVTLKVYDVLGNEIETLVDEEKAVGSYEVEFSATALPSGIYFYRLQAGNYVETKKMVLLR